MISDEKKLLLQSAKIELKEQITKIIFDFTNKYYSPESKIYPEFSHVIMDVITEILGEVEYQASYAPKFTTKQRDDICYIIGDWYLKWRHSIANYEDKTHSLGFAKEELKAMICGE